MDKGQRALLRVIAGHLGVVGKAGGWLYRNGTPLCHGWQEFWFLCLRRGWVVQYQCGTWVRQGVVCEGWRVAWGSMTADRNSVGLCREQLQAELQKCRTDFDAEREGVKL